MAPTLVPKRGMKDCNNVRITQGKVVFDNLGWSEFPDDVTPLNLDGKPALLIKSFELRNGSTRTVFGNTTDLFQYIDLSGTVEYLTPITESGTATVTNGSAIVVGVGTTWTADVSVGDQFSFGASETDPTATWYTVLTVDNDLQITLTTNFAEASAGPAAYTIRNLFTGLISDPWFTEEFYNGSGLGGASATGDRLYFTNGVDPVSAWDGSAAQVYFPALGNVDTCVDLVRYKNKLIYVAPTVGGSFEKVSIRGSDIGQPEQTVTGEAVELVVKDSVDQLVRGLRLGEQLVLYGNKSITLAQNVSLPLVYVFRGVVVDYGPLSGRGIAAFPDFHDFVGADREYRFNGATAQPINDHVFRDVTRRITPERNGFLHSHIVDELGELMWAVPLTSDADAEKGTTEQVFTTHYMENTGERNPQAFTKRELPALCFGEYKRETTLTWAQISAQWQNFNFRWNDQFFFAQFPIQLYGDELGNIFSLNTNTSKNGVAMDSFARFARVAVGTQETSAVIRRIYPYLEEIAASTDSVDIRLYGTNNLDGIATLNRNPIPRWLLS